MLKKHAWFAVVCAVAMSGSALAQGLTVGARVWQADWSLESDGVRSESLGEDPFLLLYMALHDAEVSYVFQVGTGSGWDDWSGGATSIDRTDLSFSIVSALSPELNVGFGLHAMDYAIDGGSSWTYLGPEVSVGVSVPMGDFPVAPYIAGVLGYYYWEFDGTSSEGDGSVLGYSLDAGFSFAFPSGSAKLGYRMQIAEEDSEEGFAGDDFSGAYVDLSFTF